MIAFLLSVSFPLICLNLITSAYLPLCLLKLWLGSTLLVSVGSHRKNEIHFAFFLMSISVSRFLGLFSVWTDCVCIRKITVAFRHTPMNVLALYPSVMNKEQSGLKHWFQLWKLIEMWVSIRISRCRYNLIIDVGEN